MSRPVHLSLLLIGPSLLLNSTSSAVWLRPVFIPSSTVNRKIMLSANINNADNNYAEAAPVSYHPGTDILEWDPSSLRSSTPRLAKDVNYANAVLDAWKTEAAGRSNVRARTSIAASITYNDQHGCQLYGYVYRPSCNDRNEEISNNGNRILPGIVLFHTGAGPQDVFLRWKADTLVSDSQTFPEGVVVLIADILGDETGWAWDTDRTRYETVAAEILVPDTNGERIALQSRVKAALNTLRAQPGVDPSRIGILGFCLGGHPILELGRMKDDSVRAMVSFHGVFGSVHKMKVTAEGEVAGKNNKSSTRVLICTGNDDPFAPSNDLDETKSMFENLGYQVTIEVYKDTKHGFTNPAQAYNTNPAFGFDATSCRSSWNAMLSLLKDKLKKATD